MSDCAFIDWLTECYLCEKGAAAMALRGRGRSGFTSAGYHETSYLYGAASAAAALELVPIEAVPTMRDVRDAALEDAQADLVTMVRSGMDPFAPVTRKGASA